MNSIVKHFQSFLTAVLTPFTKAFKFRMGILYWISPFSEMLILILFVYKTIGQPSDKPVFEFLLYVGWTYYRTPPIYNIHASDSRFILNSDSFSKIENQESEKLFLEITKVNLYKKIPRKRLSCIEIQLHIKIFVEKFAVLV